MLYRMLTGFRIKFIVLAAKRIVLFLFLCYFRLIHAVMLELMACFNVNAGNTFHCGFLGLSD